MIASVGVCTRPSDQTPRPAATASACEALIPVSYTHLDVYKRQGRERVDEVHRRQSRVGGDIPVVILV